MAHVLGGTSAVILVVFWTQYIYRVRVKTLYIARVCPAFRIRVRVRVRVRVKVRYIVRVRARVATKASRGQACWTRKHHEGRHAGQESITGAGMQDKKASRVQACCQVMGHAVMMLSRVWEDDWLFWYMNA